MLIIGVVGKSGSGKNYFTQVMLDYNKTLLMDAIDLDEVAHNILESSKSVKEELVKTFGESIIYKDSLNITSTLSGFIDRKRLGKLAFSSRSNLKKLEDIIQPLVVWEVVDKIDRLDKEDTLSCILINGGLIYKSPILMGMCHDIVWVHTPFFVRLWRLWKRDSNKSSIVTILKRMWSQRFLTQKRCYPDADIIDITRRKNRIKKEKIK